MVDVYPDIERAGQGRGSQPPLQPGRYRGVLSVSLYARSIEAFGAGKAFIGPGYKDPEYPWQCDLDPESMAKAIIDCHENYDKVNYRQWAEKKHDVMETVKQSVAIYGRYL